MDQLVRGRTARAEICLNSIDTDGVRTGFDLEMLDAVAARVNVPIIASGGAGKKEDFLELFHHKGIDAGLAAGIFHQKLLTIHDLKNLSERKWCRNAAVSSCVSGNFRINCKYPLWGGSMDHGTEI